MKTLPRIPAVLAAALAVGIALSGCASAEGGYTSADQAPQHGGAMPLEAAADGEADADTTERQALVITGTVVVTVDDPITAAEQATELTVAAGGRVDARTEYAPKDGEAGWATLVLRVPADALEELRAQFAELGSVDETDFSSVDVGTQQRDLETRITTLRASIARYTAWLADADTTADLIQLESAIAERQNELERLEAQQRVLADQVAMSTVTLELRSEALAPPAEGPDNFWDGLVVGWNAFVGFWAGFAVVLGVMLPWLVILAIAAVVTVLLVRRTRRAEAAAVAFTPAAATEPSPPSPTPAPTPATPSSTPPTPETPASDVADQTPN